MIDIQTILTYLTLISVPVGVAYHIMTLNNTRKNQKLTLETRQTQLFMDIYKTWTSKEFQKDVNRMLYVWEYKDYDDFFQKYGEHSDLNEHVIWDQNSMWLEGIGTLCKEGLIDPHLIFNMQSFTSSVLFIWTKYAPLIYQFRDRNSVPEFMRDFEYLSDTLREIYEKEHPDSGVHKYTLDKEELVEQFTRKWKDER